MPSLQVVDLSELPADKPEPSQVERLFSEYKKYNKERKEGEEIQKLTNKYLENKNQEGAWEKLQFDLMNNTEIGPTKRLETQQQLKEMRAQILKEREVIAKEYKNQVDEDKQDAEIQNLVDQGMPYKEAEQYVNSPASVQNRIMANHIEKTNRGMRGSKVPQVPQQDQVPTQDINAPISEVNQQETKADELPDIPPPKNMTDAEKVKWENTNQKENNKELVKTRAKKKALQGNDILVKSMNKVNETHKLPKNLDSWIIDPETGGVREEAALVGKVNKETQLYAKNLAQFIKGAKEIFGAKVSNFEVGAFINQLPSLLNTEEGRRLILKQMDLTGQLESLYNNTLDEALKKYSRTANYADIVSMVDKKIASEEGELISKIDDVVEASNYMDSMAKNPEKFKGTVLMRSPEGKFKAVRKDQVDSAPEGWSVY